jgi:hypothetical protein
MFIAAAHAAMARQIDAMRAAHRGHRRTGLFWCCSACSRLVARCSLRVQAELSAATGSTTSRERHLSVT